jgi:hypothetical protein
LRQAIATVALVALTIVPSGVVVAIAWRINRPGHIRDVEIELSHQLGLQVSLQGVRYPRPTEVLYQGFVLRQEEPHGKSFCEVARCDLARLEQADRELTLHLENLRLSGESPHQALAQLDVLMQKSSQLGLERINLTAPTCLLDLRRDDLRFQLADLAGAFIADRSVPALRLAYRMPRLAADTRCELILTRDRRSQPALASLILKSVEGSPISAKVLDVFFDAEDWLGGGARLEGTLSLHQAGSPDWQAEFQGELSDVDLSRLVAKRFPRHRLSGRARIAIEFARWDQRPGQGPGWVEVKGELSSGAGSIGVTLLAALAREMKFQPSPRLARVDSGQGEVEFRALGLRFTLQSSGEIRISGALGTEYPPDAVLAGATASLLSAPEQAASVRGLIKTLFPVTQDDPDILIPLTAQSRVLLALPLPAQAAAK